MHGKRGKIIGRRELWGANRRPVNQPPIIIDTSSTSLPCLSHNAIHPASTLSRCTVPVSFPKARAVQQPPLAKSTPARAFAIPALPPSTCRRSRHPTTSRDKRTADTIIYFANALQNCRYSFSVQSIQFSAPRVRSDGRAARALCTRAMILPFRDGTITHRPGADNAIFRR